MSVSNKQLMETIDKNQTDTSVALGLITDNLKLVSDSQIAMVERVENLKEDMGERKDEDKSQWLAITEQGKALATVKTLQDASKKQASAYGGVSGGATGGLVAILGGALAWAASKFLGN